MTTLTIDAKYHGPPKTGNGGYVSGLVANFIEGPAEVRLYKPPPLDKAMQVGQDEGVVSLLDGDELVAKGKPSSVDIEIPESQSLEMAKKASKRYVGFEHHYFPTCFVCGPGREQGDGLHIFAGPIEGNDIVAAPWTPGEDLAGPDGFILPEFVWASLDCPGAFAFGRDANPMVLGTMAAEVLAPLVAGEQCVVIGWPLSSNGRKHISGTALFTAAGELVAKARSVWIELESLEQLG